MDDNVFFALRFAAVLVEDGFQRNLAEFLPDFAGDGFPDRSGFADVLAGTIVGFVAETDNEPDTFIEQVDHVAQADFGKRLAEPDAAPGADDRFRYPVLLENGMHVFNDFLADVGLFGQGGDRNGGLCQMELENDADGVSGMG